MSKVKNKFVTGQIGQAIKLKTINQTTYDLTGHMFKGPVYSVDSLLSIESDQKTTKGSKEGYLTGILYLAPFKTIPGVNQCPMASIARCGEACLYKAGKGKFATNQAARVRKTVLFHQDKQLFFQLLKISVMRLEIQAKARGMIAAVRLNGTSDIIWEQIKDPATGQTIFETFPHIQFYDYTKLVKRDYTIFNYHLTFSGSYASKSFAAITDQMIARPNINVALVFDDIPDSFMGHQVFNGDNTDLRFLDPNSVIVGLKAKGPAKQDKTGFVIRTKEVTVNG